LAGRSEKEVTMKVFGDMSLGGLAQLVQGEALEGGAANLAARVLDTDGDGRSDLFLVDADNDGTVDGVVRGLDMNGDGQNDAYITYNEDGSVRSIGRVGATGDLEVVYEEPGLFDQLLADLGLVDLPSPEEALFTSFDDPYIVGTYGEYGDDLPDELPEPLVLEPSDVVDMDESEYLELSSGATVVDDAGLAADEVGGLDDSASAADTASADETSSVTATEASAESSSEVSGESETTESQPGEPAAPEILEVGDHGDGWLYAQVDVDGDGVADRTDDLQRTVDGWEADVNRDGSKETVAFDADRDGRVDSVDKSGSGDWAGSTQAWEVVEQPSELVDDGLYQGDEEAAVVAADSSDAGVVDTSMDDTGEAVDASVDTDAGASYDSDTSVDTSSSYDSGGSSDVGSTVDSGGGSDET
jgi:hypothetical protein